MCHCAHTVSHHHLCNCVPDPCKPRLTSLGQDFLKWESECISSGKPFVVKKLGIPPSHARRNDPRPGVQRRPGGHPAAPRESRQYISAKSVLRSELSLSPQLRQKKQTPPLQTERGSLRRSQVYFLSMLGGAGRGCVCVCVVVCDITGLGTRATVPGAVRPRH